MSVESLQRLSLLFYIIGGVLFVAAITLFFAFRIPKVFNELTGIAARQGIKAIRFENRDSKHLSKKSASVRNMMSSTGNLRTMMTPSGSLKQNSMIRQPESPVQHTTKLMTTKLTNNSVQTTVLQDAETVRETEYSTISTPIPILNPGMGFVVVEELSYMCCEEIIE